MAEGSGCGAEDSLEPELGNTFLGLQKYRSFYPGSVARNLGSRIQRLGRSPKFWEIVPSVPSFFQFLVPVSRPQFLPAPTREKLDLRNGPQADMASQS